ncbi:ccr4-not transcription complex [Moniliophthora roreri]|nr:ccr4-not transcription complex [Moniliophthora roreri]
MSGHPEFKAGSLTARGTSDFRCTLQIVPSDFYSCHTNPRPDTRFMASSTPSHLRMLAYILIVLDVSFPSKDHLRSAVTSLLSPPLYHLQYRHALPSKDVNLESIILPLLGHPADHTPSPIFERTPQCITTIQAS